jgi:hypothetical protein
MDSAAALIPSALLLVGLAGCAPAVRTSAPRPPNPIAEYLDGVEVQAEEGQQGNICQALSDLAFLDRDELRRRRYSDYQGRPGVWDLPRLLHAHFVPDSGKFLPQGEEFWTHVDDANVRRLTRRVHDALECARDAGPRSSLRSSPAHLDRRGGSLRFDVESAVE